MGQRMKLAQIYIYAVGNRYREISWDPNTDPFAFYPWTQNPVEGNGRWHEKHIFRQSFITFLRDPIRSMRIYRLGDMLKINFSSNKLITIILYL